MLNTRAELSSAAPIAKPSCPVTTTRPSEGGDISIHASSKPC